MCWTVKGDEDFRQVLDEMCMNLNDLSAGCSDRSHLLRRRITTRRRRARRESRDDFVMLFVGPTPRPSCRPNATLLVEDVVALMERHFDGAELGGVVGEIDKLFSQRFDALVNSLELGKPPRGPGGSGHGGGSRRPRHLH
jgi:hypothetical protein